jgi:hypothetical protein
MITSLGISKILATSYQDVTKGPDIELLWYEQTMPRSNNSSDSIVVGSIKVFTSSALRSGVIYITCSKEQVCLV